MDFASGSQVQAAKLEHTCQACQKLIGSLRTYELSLPNQKKSKSFALKTINERVDVHDSSDDDAVEKDVAYLAKNF